LSAAKEAGKAKMRCIAITGGPGGGKSTVAALLRQELDTDVVIVPEVATHLLGGFFPAISNAEERRAVQRAIYHVQVNLEAVHRARAPDGKVLVCDRGILDGAAYWPDGTDDFFQSVCGEASHALERYDAVVFLETAAAGGLSIESENAARLETAIEALRVDALLRKVWSAHPVFRFVPHAKLFDSKVEHALDELRALIRG
jgi:predicted ATPase